MRNAVLLALAIDGVIQMARAVHPGDRDWVTRVLHLVTGHVYAALAVYAWLYLA
jgi:hypothetical protein